MCKNGGGGIMTIKTLTVSPVNDVLSSGDIIILLPIIVGLIILVITVYILLKTMMESII